jgi:lipopolysaccharide export system protein LptA
VEQVVMTGGVRLHERVRASEGVPWSERELHAGVAELAMGSDGAGKTLLKDAKATGSALLTVVSPAGKDGAAGSTKSALGGDVLTAHFVRVDGADHLAEVHGDGHAALRRMSATGVVNTSTGDSLVAKFRPAGVRAGAKGRGPDEVATVVEVGHVVMTETPVKKAGDSSAPQEERATAERAAYDGELERMTLTGNVQVSDGESVLWADRVVTEQESQDATADGSVKVSYRQPGSNDEAVHVLAARAEMKHESQVATFYGSAGKPARLWQAASQVEAPVVEFERKQRRLTARGDGQGAPMAVHTVLVSGRGAGVGAGAGASSAGAGAAKGAAAKGGVGGLTGGKTNVIRVASRELVYSDEARRADFTGGVKVDGADGTMKGQQAVVYLESAPRSGGGGGVGGGVGKTASSATGVGGFMGGSVERVVATGHIEIEQPGRRATGEQVVYTASDGVFVLTGTAAVLPKVVDQQRGTVTGTQLQFHTGDESVVVSNGSNGSAGQRVRTETRVKSKQ